MNQLMEEKYGRVICYPRYNAGELKRRIENLKRLRVVALEFVGKKSAFNMPVLGKGCVGIVVIAHTDTGIAALKIRRLDADRLSMGNEAEMLRKANGLGVGPRFINVTEDFLLMSFVGGALFPEWIETLKGRGTNQKLRQVLQEVLEQCWRLDQGGLDHGELSSAHKHIIVNSNNNPYLVDFETASTTRRTSNVTSISQYIFLSKTAKTIRRKLGRVDEKELIEVLRAYKEDHTRENFEKILDLCKLREFRKEKTEK